MGLYAASEPRFPCGVGDVFHKGRRPDSIPGDGDVVGRSIGGEAPNLIASSIEGGESDRPDDFEIPVRGIARAGGIVFDHADRDRIRNCVRNLPREFPADAV